MCAFVCVHTLFTFTITLRAGLCIERFIATMSINTAMEFYIKLWCEAYFVKVTYLFGGSIFSQATVSEYFASIPATEIFDVDRSIITLP